MLQNILNFFKSKPESKVQLQDSLINLLQFQPNQPELFVQAFTPRSAQKINKDGISFNYERLEFLGDAMLGAVIAEYLYNKAPAEKEGYLTQMRSKIVSRKHLNEIGKDLNIKSYVQFYSKKNLSYSQHIEGDIFEALIGAIYKDQGFDVTYKFIHRVVIDKYVDIKKMENKISSYKSFMYEWVQKNKVQLEFNTFEENNAEDVVIFVSIVRLDGKICGKGRGTSKKKAEENAAKRVYYSKQKSM